MSKSRFKAYNTFYFKNNTLKKEMGYSSKGSPYPDF